MSKAENQQWSIIDEILTNEVFPIDKRENEAFYQGYAAGIRYQLASQEAGKQGIARVQPFDVLGGSGSPVRDHHGNLLFRETCAEYYDEFQGTTNKDLKEALRIIIMDEILARGGRLLNRASLQGGWIEKTGDLSEWRRKIDQRMLDHRKGSPLSVILHQSELSTCSLDADFLNMWFESRKVTGQSQILDIDAPHSSKLDH